MPRRTNLELEVDRLASNLARTLGHELRSTRRRRRLTLEALGARVGLTHARIGQIERGHGDTAPLRVWVALGLALDRPIGAAFTRERIEPRDAGHLAVQELLLRLARQHGRHRQFELPSRPADPARSVDVGLRDDAHRALIMLECLNRVMDLGDAARQMNRKEIEARDVAMLVGRDEEPYRVAWCWVFRESAANRELVRRYPEVLRARFPGSSVEWVRCLAEGAAPPRQPGLAWADPGSGRLRALRLG